MVDREDGFSERHALGVAGWPESKTEDEVATSLLKVSDLDGNDGADGSGKADVEHETNLKGAFRPHSTAPQANIHDRGIQWGELFAAAQLGRFLGPISWV